MKRVLCIHGVGYKEDQSEPWQTDWRNSIQKHSGFKDVKVEYLEFDALFKANRKKMGIQYAKAIFEFLRSWISSVIKGEEKSRGFSDILASTAGMPAQFATQEKLRADLRRVLDKHIKDFKPHVIFAHSLGGLICYDYFRQEKMAGRKHDIVLMSGGTQIGHPALLQIFGGVILPLELNFWINLLNRNDRVFASRPIKVSSDRYKEIEVPFTKDFINHDGLCYLTQDGTVQVAWPLINAMLKPEESKDFQLFSPLSRSFSTSKATRKPKRKAVLFGINDYPDEASRLEGCVNDVFRISEVLQEYGFSPSEIRVALNERVTADGIRKRMEWLLDDARPGDLRIMFYSGHGAQIPSPHDTYEIDCNDECLVPYDFDWTLENAYTDKEFLSLYAQLSLDVNFISILDCCHSGGMTRANGPKPKGLSAPDDIRHREIKWHEDSGMWVPRAANLKDLDLFKSKTKDTAMYNGLNGKTNKLGRAIPLWTDVKKMEAAKKTYGVVGPYMPVILQACQENESAYEYRHGVTSFGAFTYSITNILRKRRAAGMPLTFDGLVKDSRTLLKALDYQQTPIVVGPKVRTNGAIPFPQSK